MNASAAAALYFDLTVDENTLEEQFLARWATIVFVEHNDVALL